MIEMHFVSCLEPSQNLTLFVLTEVVQYLPTGKILTVYNHSTLTLSYSQNCYFMFKYESSH